MVIWRRPLPETARAPSNLTNENVSNRGNKGFSSPVYCDRNTSHASINSTYSRINRERGESAFPTIGFNGRSGYKQNAAAWWKGYDLLDGVYLVCWCNIRYWFFLFLLLVNWYFWCGLQFLFYIEDPPALFPDRLGTDRRAGHSSLCVYFGCRIDRMAFAQWRSIDGAAASI